MGNQVSSASSFHVNFLDVYKLMLSTSMILAAQAFPRQSFASPQLCLPARESPPARIKGGFPLSLFTPLNLLKPGARGMFPGVQIPRGWGEPFQVAAPLKGWSLRKPRPGGTLGDSRCRRKTGPGSRARSSHSGPQASPLLLSGGLPPAPPGAAGASIAGVPAGFGKPRRVCRLKPEPAWALPSKVKRDGKVTHSVTRWCV